jgi:hypothetical protein
MACFLYVSGLMPASCVAKLFRGWNGSGLKWDSDLPPGPKSHFFFRRSSNQLGGRRPYCSLERAASSERALFPRASITRA